MPYDRLGAAASGCDNVRMTARDRFTADLLCPVCGRAGVAHLSEEDGWAYMNGPKLTSVDEMPAGFISGVGKSWIGNRFDIFCAEHKVSALKR